MPTPRTSGLRSLATRLRRSREADSRRPFPWRTATAATLTLVLLATLAYVGWQFTRAHLQAIAVLDLVANKPVPSLLQRTITEPVLVTETTLPLPSGPIRARLYTPEKHPNAPALMVLHGVHHLGMDEPRMIAFASAMASCGIRVLTPELPGIKDYQVDARTIPVIGDAATWLANNTGGGAVGILGLSFSGSLSLLAAANPEYRPHIKFVVAIGSEDEMSRVADFYRTGEDVRPAGDGTAEHLTPHEYGALVIEYEHVTDFVPRRDIPAIRPVLRAHLYEDRNAEDAALTRLNPQQLALARQLIDTSSPATRAKLAAAETRHIEDMAGVSPHGHLAELTTPVYLLHGEGDNIIPSAETQWIAAELPSETLKASLISPVLSHLDMDGTNPGPLDQWRLVHFFALILHAAQGA